MTDPNDAETTDTTRTATPAASPPPQPPPPLPPPPPAWRPSHDDRGRSASLFFGVITLLVGLWFFASQTLGLDLPLLDWDQLWPIVVIAVGAWIVLGSIRRRP